MLRFTLVACLVAGSSAFTGVTPGARLGLAPSGIRRASALSSKKSAALAPSMVASLPGETAKALPDYSEWKDLSQAPPFTLKDIQEAIPKHLWEKNAAKSMSYLIKDVLIVGTLLAVATVANNPLVWPLYWLAQGTMFWALFVVGHDCGHASFSNNKALNNVMGHITHSSIMVPYHGWRISHRTHHGNHGHVENDESWYPTTQANYEDLRDATDVLGRVGNWVRFSMLGNLLAYPLYLMNRSPGRLQGTHYDWGFTQEKHGPDALFKESEGGMIKTSTACLGAMVALLAGVGAKFGLGYLFNSYIMPYVVFVMWLDLVTYLHHTDNELPWYRDPEWTYLRGGLSTTDRDYGVLNKVHHDIGTHVVHHLFPQIPHYNLCEATEAVKPLMGPYYREPEKSGFLPFHLWGQMSKFVKECKYVKNEGSIVYYQNAEGKVTSSEEGAKKLYNEEERA